MKSRRPGGRDRGELATFERAAKDLAAGVIHATSSRQTVFFLGDRLSGVIDFYFACNDFYAYDLAVCLNAWCFERTTASTPPSAADDRGYHKCGRYRRRR